MSESRTLGAVILAAGKGKRMNSIDKNKVTIHLNNKPLITYSLDLLENIGFKTIVIVIGHAAESVKEAVKNYQVIFAEQTHQFGTGDALKVALEKLPNDIANILVLGGDDSHLYTEDIITKLREKHFNEKAKITFLTIQLKDPAGIGRVIRKPDGDVIAIVEEKDANNYQKKINEVNSGCYLFNVEFLKSTLPLVKKSPVTGEYYLTSLIDIAINIGAKIATVQAGNIPWRGINTPEELAEAEKLLSH